MPDYDVNLAMLPSSILANGSIPFSNGTRFVEDNANLNWDNTNKVFKVGGSNKWLQVSTAAGKVSLTATNSTGSSVETDLELVATGDTTVNSWIKTKSWGGMQILSTSTSQTITLGGSALGALISDGTRSWTFYSQGMLMSQTGVSGNFLEMGISSTTRAFIASNKEVGFQWRSVLADTSGTINGTNHTHSLAPTSGTAIFNIVNIASTINQTGTASGTIRGIYYNPTVTSVLGTHNAWESTSGNFVIGGTTRLDLNGALKFTNGLTNFILDSNGNNIVGLLGISGAGNYLTFKNGQTGGATIPTISVDGADSNININIIPKGTGGVSISSGFLSVPTLITTSTSGLQLGYIVGFLGATSGTQKLYSVSANGGVSVSSGTANFTYFSVDSVTQISQTSTASGSITLFNAAPTVASVKGIIYGFRSQLAASPAGGGTAWNIYADGTAPNKFGGACMFPIVTKTANYTATTSDHTIRCDAASGAFTVTLPTAASFYNSTTTTTGGILVIKKIDSTINAITIDGNGTELIDEQLTILITSQFSSVMLQSNGTSWDII